MFKVIKYSDPNLRFCWGEWGLMYSDPIFFLSSKRKKPAVRRVSLIGTWQCPTLTWGNPTLPSALIRFTSEFGMGSGGTVSLWLPRNLVTIWESLILIQSVSNYFLLCLAFSLSLLTTPTSHRSLLGVVWLSLSGN